MAVDQSLLESVWQVKKCRSDRCIISWKLEILCSVMDELMVRIKNKMSPEVKYYNEYSFLDECKKGGVLNYALLKNRANELEREIKEMNEYVLLSEMLVVKKVQEVMGNDLNQYQILSLLIDCFPIQKMNHRLSEKGEGMHKIHQGDSPVYLDINHPLFLLGLVLSDSMSSNIAGILSRATDSKELRGMILNVMLNQKQKQVTHFLDQLFIEQKGVDTIAIQLISFEAIGKPPAILKCKVENLGFLFHWFQEQITQTLGRAAADPIIQKIHNSMASLKLSPLNSVKTVLGIYFKFNQIKSKKFG